MKLNLSLSSDAELAGKLRRMTAPERLMATFAEVASDMERQTQSRFESGVSPDGKSWKPSVRALREGGVTLVDTAHLKQSITSRFGGGFAEVGTNVVYAAIHQLGGKAGRGGSAAMPSRPYLGFGRTDKNNIRRIIIENLEAA